MTEALRRVVAEREGLPDEEHDRIADLLRDELDRRWSETLEHPDSVSMLDGMAQAAHPSAREGRISELRF